MANVTISQISDELTNPNNGKEDVTYIETDHSTDGTKKMSLQTIRKLITDNWSEPDGGYILDGSDDYVSIPDADTNGNLDFGTADFSSAETIELDGEFRWRKLTSSGGYQFGINSINSGKYCYLLQIYSSGSSAVKTYYAYYDNNSAITGKHHFLFEVTQGTLSIYKDGVLDKTVSIISDYSATSTENFYIGSDGSAYFYSGQPLRTQFFNMAVSSYIEQLLNNGLSETAVIPFELQGARQTPLTSGTLEVDKKYIIDTYISDDDFTNVGASSNASGEIFIATGTTPTKWTNGSSLRQIGNVLDLKGENMGANGAIGTLGGKSVIANTSGSPVARTDLRDGRSGVSTTEVQLENSQKAVTMLKGIIAIEKGGVSNSIALGTATSTYDLLDATTGALTANEEKYFEINSYSGSDRDLYTVAGASSVDIILIYEEVA